MELPQGKRKNLEEINPLKFTQKRYERVSLLMVQLLNKCEKTKSIRQMRKAKMEFVYLHFCYLNGLEELKTHVATSIAILIHKEQKIVLKLLQGSLHSIDDRNDKNKLVTIFTEAEAWEERLSRDFYHPLTYEEKKKIREAMVPDIGDDKGWYGGGHWFQCPNGHPYTIGECGGANEESRCPECGETVGGSSHHLAEGNQLAREW